MLKDVDESLHKKHCMRHRAHKLAEQEKVEKHGNGSTELATSSVHQRQKNDQEPAEENTLDQYKSLMIHCTLFSVRRYTQTQNKMSISDGYNSRLCWHPQPNNETVSVIRTWLKH
eukprot:scpid53352/ scgid28706/ 